MVAGLGAYKCFANRSRNHQQAGNQSTIETRLSARFAGSTESLAALMVATSSRDVKLARILRTGLRTFY